MANTTVEVKKNANENNMNLMRRFSRKMQETGNIQKVKGKRYNERKLSKLKVKEATLKRLKKKASNEKLYKLGKLNRTSRFTKK